MANVLHRITKKYLESVNTPDYPTEDWIINPVLPNCKSSEWVIEGDVVRETTQAEKAANFAAKKADKAAENAADEKDSEDKADASAAARLAFVALSSEDKLMYLYDNNFR